MKIRHLGWLWANSATICEGSGIVLASRRIRFVLKALAVYESIVPMIDAPNESSLGRLMLHRPEALGAIVWPYQCTGWTPCFRLARIRDHYGVIDKIGGAIDFPVDGRIVLLDLGDIRKGLHIVVDQPVWFMREGQLAINLFVHDVRMYTLAFSFFHKDGEIAAFVGAIQGRDIDGALEEYRELTKASNGMRPRDFLIEVFRMFCAELAVGRIFAVSNKHRHHKDRYFGAAAKEKSSANYDEIWEDRGGIRVDATCYQIEVNSAERDL